MPKFYILLCNTVTITAATYIEADSYEDAVNNLDDYLDDPDVEAGLREEFVDAAIVLAGDCDFQSKHCKILTEEQFDEWCD